MDFYIFEDSSDLENLPFLNIESTLIFHFCFLDGLLKLCFLTRCLSLLSPQLMKKKRNKNQLFKYFWRKLLRKANFQKFEYIFKKLNSLKSNYLINYFQRKNLLSKTFIFDNSNSHCLEKEFVSLLCLSLDLSYWEST